MSTANFYNQRNFDLWVISSDDDDDFFWDDLQINFDYEIKNIPLVFHKIELKSGYYSGVQIFFEEIENPHELDNDDCRYYFDMCKSEAVKKYDAEIKRINKKYYQNSRTLDFLKLIASAFFLMVKQFMNWQKTWLNKVLQNKKGR